MTEYQRTTTRETEVGGTPTQTYQAPAPVVTAPAPAVNSVRTTESSYTPAGPGGATVASRIVTFAFGILQALLILRIILLLLVANPGNDVVGFIFGSPSRSSSRSSACSRSTASRPTRAPCSISPRSWR